MAIYIRSIHYFETLDQRDLPVYISYINLWSGRYHDISLTSLTTGRYPDISAFDAKTVQDIDIP